MQQEAESVNERRATRAALDDGPVAGTWPARR